jgi:hypothetical protein
MMNTRRSIMTTVIATLIALVVAMPPAHSVKRVISDGDIYLHGAKYTSFGNFKNTEFSGAQCTTDAETFYPDDARIGLDPNELSNAWLGGPTFTVNGTEFQDSDDAVEQENESITAGPESLEGLRVSISHAALPTKPILRSTVRLRNNSDSGRTRTIVFDQAADGGLADDYEARDTSSGNTAVAPSDKWVVWSNDPAAPDRPVIATAFYGRGNVREQVNAVLCDPTDADDPLAVDFVVRVPGNSTRLLVFFSGMAKTNAKGMNLTPSYDNAAPVLFDGMSAKDKNKVLNWNL